MQTECTSRLSKTYIGIVVYDHDMVYIQQRFIPEVSSTPKSPRRCPGVQSEHIGKPLVKWSLHTKALELLWS